MPSAHVPQEQVPEAPEDSGGFLASLSMPFAAFAGFGASETAPKAPPPKAKPPEKAVEKVTLGWQPWATYAAAAEEDTYCKIGSVADPSIPKTYQKVQFRHGES